MPDPSQDNMAIAALFAALVEALDERANGIAKSFARHLEDTQARLAEHKSDQSRAIEILSWTLALLDDDLDRNEPASVVYAKTRVPEEDQLPSTDKVQLPTLEEAVRFWARLPAFDQARATVETASGHRFEPTALSSLVKRFKEHPAP